MARRFSFLGEISVPSLVRGHSSPYIAAAKPYKPQAMATVVTIVHNLLAITDAT